MISTFELGFNKKISISQAEIEKRCAYKKKSVFINHNKDLTDDKHSSTATAIRTNLQ